ncbi:putative LIM domain-containing serine/threonine-protein kinase [Tetrabaena socialis]|uniref:Putative LIM domain-containing serine/threonine-protein kinase n=1 Tax=Tetrabaena socialis TaxID=47790 RepID=A0A2J7ZSH6_9CHLO|nr:putative LIM domain-containing serine/threonine-protein kinase [Tetrabaena socialis]|eukprot:PNH03215.1 putative LIM domain-containing serine/threonine-protein kinase [Tetrabaena socialis]
MFLKRLLCCYSDVGPELCQNAGPTHHATSDVKNPLLPQPAVAQASAAACSQIVASCAGSGLPRVAAACAAIGGAFADGRVAIFASSGQACVFSRGSSGEAVPAVSGLGTALFESLSDAAAHAADGLAVVRNLAWHDSGVTSTLSNSSTLFVPLPPRRDQPVPGPGPSPKHGSAGAAHVVPASSRGSSGPFFPPSGPLSLGPGDLLALPINRHGRLAGALLLGWAGTAGPVKATHSLRSVVAAAGDEEAPRPSPHGAAVSAGGIGGGDGCGAGGSWVVQLRSADIVELRRLAQLVGFSLLPDPVQALYLEQVSTLLCQLTDPDCPGLHDLVAAVLDAIPSLLYGRFALALQPLLAAVPASAPGSSCAPAAAVFFSRRPQRLLSSSLSSHPHQYPHHQHYSGVTSPIVPYGSPGTMFNAPGMQPGVAPAAQRLMLASSGGGAAGAPLNSSFGGLPRPCSTQSLAFGTAAAASDGMLTGGGVGGVGQVKAVHSALAHTLLQRALLAGAHASNPSTGTNGTNGLGNPPGGGAATLVIVVPDASGQVLEEEQPGRDVLLAANLTGAGVASLLLCAEAQGQGLQGHPSPGASRPQSQAQGQATGVLRGLLQSQLQMAAAAAGAEARTSQTHVQGQGATATAVSSRGAQPVDVSARGGREGQAGPPPRRRFPSAGGLQHPTPSGAMPASADWELGGVLRVGFQSPGDAAARALWSGGAAPPLRLALYVVSAEAVPAGVLEAVASELKALMPVVFAVVRSALEGQPLLVAEWRHLASQQHQRATASGLTPPTPITPGNAAAQMAAAVTGSGLASPRLPATGSLPSPRHVPQRAASGGSMTSHPQQQQQRSLFRAMLNAAATSAGSPIPPTPGSMRTNAPSLGSPLAPMLPTGGTGGSGRSGNQSGRWLRTRPSFMRPPSLAASSPPAAHYLQAGPDARPSSASYLHSRGSYADNGGEGEEEGAEGDEIGAGDPDPDEDVVGLLMRSEMEAFPGCYFDAATRRRSRALARLPSCPALQLEMVSGPRPLELLVSSARSRLAAVAAGQEAGEEARMAAQQDLSAVELLEVIGRGGQGVVFRGSLHGLEVAVKVLEHVGRSPLEHEGVSMTPARGSGGETSTADAAEGGTAGQGANVENLPKFKREALEVAVMTTLSHPNIVQVFAEFSEAVVVEKQQSSGPVDPQRAGPAPRLQLCAIDSPLLGGNVPSPLNSVLCLEYCDAGTLLAAARRGDFRMPGSASHEGPVWPDLVPLYTSLLEVALALRYLHSRRLVHCDLKPGNVLLRANARDGRGWTCKLSDFGCVRLMDAAGPDGQPGVTLADVYGTVPYMSPEIFQKGRMLTAAVDIYAFGFVMWELLHCRSAFSKIKHDELPALVVLQNLRPEFHALSPPEYSTLATLCWSPAPERRPSAGHLVTTLQQLLASAKAAAARQQQRQLQHRNRPAAPVAARSSANASSGLGPQLVGGPQRTPFLQRPAPARPQVAAAAAAGTARAVPPAAADGARTGLTGRLAPPPLLQPPPAPRVGGERSVRGGGGDSSVPSSALFSQLSTLSSLRPPGA